METLVSSLIKMGVKQLTDAGIDTAESEAELLYRFLMKIDRVQYLRRWSQPASDKEIDQYLDLIAERAKRRPLQHIIGSVEFIDIPIVVREGALVPRMDSETVALVATDMAERKDRVLDLCCGSGILGIYIATKKDVKLTAADNSDEAIALTEENASKNGVKIDARKGDLFDAIGRKKYDLIVTNPPYIPSGDIVNLQIEVRDYDPREALDGGEDGLDFYRKIISEAPNHLRKRGRIVLEIGYNQAESVVKLLEETGKFEDIETHKDVGGNDRVVSAHFVK